MVSGDAKWAGKCRDVHELHDGDTRLRPETISQKTSHTVNEGRASSLCRDICRNRVTTSQCVIDIQEALDRVFALRTICLPGKSAQHRA